MNKSVKVYLGYEDEYILDIHKNDVSFTTNKIGGQPDWPPLSGLEFNSSCPTCSVRRPLLLQCYAPLPDSPFHRTLYVFACINPTCWNNLNSWSCFRSQYLDPQYVDSQNNKKCEVVKAVTAHPTAAWCDDANEWGDEADTKESDVFSAQPSIALQSNVVERMSDSDDDCQMDILGASLDNVTLSNSVAATSTLVPTVAFAEIEGNDVAETVTVDEPVLPNHDIIKLLTQVPELPTELKTSESISFQAKFVAVEEEFIPNDDNSGHIKELLEQYKKASGDDLKNLKKNKSKGHKNAEVEEYERAVPLHGNELFHNFLNRIQLNPSQILRYSLGGQPIPMSPLPAYLRSKKCSHCGGSIIFELQILPTIIPSLKIGCTDSTLLEFGTVLIYTCSKSCWQNNDKILTEIVVVQSEPM